MGNIDIKGATNFHKKHGRLATLTAVQPGGRLGAFQLKDSTEITAFHERPKGDGAWVKGGFFVLEPEAIDYVEGDSVSWEREPLERLFREDHAWRHDGIWQSVDTLRDKRLLNDIWNSGKRLGSLGATSVASPRYPWT